MTKSETLAAAEIMRRAAEGEMVELKIGEKWEVVIPNWDWRYRYRILDFPLPPPNAQWHNPAGLNATQVGVHEGWRLRLQGERFSGFPYDVEYWDDGMWYVLPRPSMPIGSLPTLCTFRTKSPLPEVKADPMAVAVAWSSYSIGKKTPEYAQAWADFIGGWKACKEHYKIP